MMGRKEFAEEVLENMKKHLENGVEANVCTMLTTNDVKTIGLFIRNADQHVSIQVAMEGLYQRYLDYCKRPLSAASRAAFPGQSGPY